MIQFALLLRHQTSAVDEGFEMFFKSQRTTYHNIKVNFTKPLPSWLKGTYVSNMFHKGCWIFKVLIDTISMIHRFKCPISAAMVIFYVTDS